MARTILVTGVSRPLGARVAHLLAAHEEVGRVIGMDVITPREDLGRAEFVRSDVRNPVVGRLLEQAEVDTVVHLALSISAVDDGPARAFQKETNVIGTMQLFAACQQASSLRRVLLKSTCAVYGSSAHDPALFTEDQTSPRGRAFGSVKDALEVERYLRTTRRRRPDLESTTLRLAHVVGPRSTSQLLSYLSLPVVPIPLGFDPRLQFLHEDDAVSAIVSAAVGPAAGVVNVAAAGVITLTQAVALAGRVGVPVPTATGLIRMSRLGRMSPLDLADVAYLKYGRVIDTTRARTRLGFVPTYTTKEAFRAAAAVFPPGVPDLGALWERVAVLAGEGGAR